MKLVETEPFGGKVLLFAHEKQRRKKCQPKHLHQRFVIDAQHGTVECADCGEIVSAFHALMTIAREESHFRRSVDAAKARRAEAEAYKPWLRAVKALEKVWRGGRYLPQCPHCRKGIKAEALANAGMVLADEAGQPERRG